MLTIGLCRQSWTSARVSRLCMQIRFVLDRRQGAENVEGLHGGWITWGVASITVAVNIAGTFDDVIVAESHVGTLHILPNDVTKKALYSMTSIERSLSNRLNASKSSKTEPCILFLVYRLTVRWFVATITSLHSVPFANVSRICNCDTALSYFR